MIITFLKLCYPELEINTLFFVAQQSSVKRTRMRVKAPNLSFTCTMIVTQIGAALFFTKAKEGTGTASKKRLTA